MRRWLLDHLICPASGEPLHLDVSEQHGDEIATGKLTAPSGATYRILRGIPRFVPASNYADSFALQWTRYARLRSDLYNGTDLIRDTLTRRFEWSSSSLDGKTVLECGCGAGNDTEILLELGAERVVAFDYSTSVEAARQTVSSPKAQFLQADVYDVPVEHETFDVVLCHRMLQHTPDPGRALRSIVRYLAPGGELALHSYDAGWRSKLHFKTFWRPLTRRMDPARLLHLLEHAGRILYPMQGLQTLLTRHIPYLRSLTNKVIPFYNYAHLYREADSTLTNEELYQVSLLDTFDALSPRYDNPQKAETVLGWLRDAGLIDVRLTAHNPLVAVARKPLARSVTTTAE